MSECYVSARDFAANWTTRELSTVAPVLPWNGVERRSAVVDRRTRGHERRWEASRGRRFRLIGRRLADRTAVAIPRADARQAQAIIDRKAKGVSA